LRKETTMEAPVKRQSHPVVIVAAIAVTVFSLVGVGAVLGWIPTSSGGAPAAKVQADATGPAVQAPEQPKPQAEAAKPAAPNPVVKQAKPHPKPVAKAEPPQQVVQDVVPPPPAPVLAATCRECAVIEEVREVEKAGQASGVGAVGGAVVGGVLGHQVGSGRGKDVATCSRHRGASPGIRSKERLKTKEYQITVRAKTAQRPVHPGHAAKLARRWKIIDGAIRDRS
jgi:uncharacterized protein YcfJ